MSIYYLTIVSVNRICKLIIVYKNKHNEPFDKLAKIYF